MKSPFPGMDPYLERYWGDVHHGVITYIRDWLQSRLPSDLRARMQERVYIELPDAQRAIYYPDVRVVERPDLAPGARTVATIAEPSTAEGVGNGDSALSNPLIIHLDMEPLTEGYVEIIDVKAGHRVVTAIEVLSPTNTQPGEGQRLYVQKRAHQQSAGVNTVEIDLLRGGQRILMIPTEQIPPSHRTPYQLSVWRAQQPRQIEIYRLPLAAQLPEVAIPLRLTDPDVVLNLQAIIDQCYRNGGYDDIDYRGEPDPPLPAADAAWADALLREMGKR